jgi:hypothetical protein
VAAASLRVQRALGDEFCGCGAAQLLELRTATHEQLEHVTTVLLKVQESLLEGAERVLRLLGGSEPSPRLCGAPERL